MTDAGATGMIEAGFNMSKAPMMVSPDITGAAHEFQCAMHSCRPRAYP